MSFFVGLGVGLSLIVAIGAQNAFVLRQGIRRQHVFVVALICAASDAILITAGVAGVGAALVAAPWLIALARWCGVAFLVTYAVLALRRAIRPAKTGLVATHDGTPDATSATASNQPAHTLTQTRTSGTLLTVVLATLAITWLNPHVYLDTVIFLGSVAQTHHEGRWLFAAGAACGSFVWFFSLAYGARYLSRWLAHPRAWRILDAIIALFMLGIAAVLAFGA